MNKEELKVKLCDLIEKEENYRVLSLIYKILNRL